MYVNIPSMVKNHSDVKLHVPLNNAKLENDAANTPVMCKPVKEIKNIFTNDNYTLKRLRLLTNVLVVLYASLLSKEMFIACFLCILLRYVHTVPTGDIFKLG